MDFKELTILTTRGLAERLAQESGVGIPAFSYGSLKAISQQDHPFVIRTALKPGSKKPKVSWVYEWFLIWILHGNQAVNDSIHRNTAPKINQYLQSLTKKTPGRPSSLEQKKDEFLKVVGGES